MLASKVQRHRLSDLVDQIVGDAEFKDAVLRLTQRKSDGPSIEVAMNGIFGSGYALTVAAGYRTFHPATKNGKAGGAGRGSRQAQKRKLQQADSTKQTAESESGVAIDSGDRIAGSPPLLVIAQDADSADLVINDLKSFGLESVELFPAMEGMDARALAIDTAFGERIRILKRCIRGDFPTLLVAPIQALIQPNPNPENLEASSRSLVVGQQLDLDQLCQWLVEHGYHSTSAVELPGEFSRRGGILDVFAADWDQPARIELFDDEIESIRRFELATQRSLERENELQLTVLRPDQHDGQPLAAFLPDETVKVLIEMELIDEHMKQTIRLTDDLNNVLDRDFVWQSMAGFNSWSLSRLGLDENDLDFNVAIEPLEKFSHDLAELRIELNRLGDGFEVYLACPTEGDLERVQEIFSSTEVSTSGRLHLVEGSVQQGFRLRRHGRVALDCDQLLGRHDLRRPPRRRLGKAIDSFLDLREGDLVVHLAHGIGRFRGLKVLKKEGNFEEHLEIEFHGGTRIFVPAAKIDLVQKYIGGARATPALAKVGGKSWLRQKQAAENAVTDLAAEMLEVQAARAAQNGVVYSKDTEWQHEFEGSFPYRETDDQLKAIRSIKDDMESSRAMDRLLCGDVGFGKTEVAMRAAFKAVENGYQVGVLVPTTILAEQHFRTFRERMSGFPFDIAKLSRFCSAKEQREIVKGLKEGRIDIVVGTHRLASLDVKFFNLGLLIIDEEQRFGVEIKERLKSMKNTVDVMTMSATPIPRTLHMSLVGVRDICSLETPPEERIGVETRVCRFDDEIIRHAAHRELSRGGQIYFIHNRVNDIHLIRDRLQYILPEVRIGIAHGQMPESELEPVMTDFINHELDVLLATTIVENGLDIPNANTIFINEADRYGLSDLHQLRGRVGRYKHRAYAYLMIEPHKHVSPSASKRLRAIEEFSDMGAGFQIAMRDLEIRGAGNLLGTEQSGHIAAVGYELYCQLLENAVRNLKKMPPRISLDVDVDLPIEAFLPDDFVPDKRHKIDFYRRLSRVERFDQIEELRMELIDRFGALPEPAKHLLQLVELKLDAAVWQIMAIYLDENDIVFKAADSGRMGQLAKLNGRKMRMATSELAHVRTKPGQVHGIQWLEVARSILRPETLPVYTPPPCSRKGR